MVAWPACRIPKCQPRAQAAALSQSKPLELKGASGFMHVCQQDKQDIQLSEQLFVSWVVPHLGKALTMQRLSHYTVGAIATAYNSKGV